MGLVSMILELREKRGLDVASASPADPNHRLSSEIKTRTPSPSDAQMQEAISLRTFAMRIDTAKRRSQKLG